MNTLDKLKLLGSKSKWDTCGPNMDNQSLPGVYQAQTPQGTCSLMKVLYTNQCTHDCAYCTNSSSCQKKITSFQPQELANAFMQYLHKNIVEGLFLSSAVPGDQNAVTDRMIETAVYHRTRLTRVPYGDQAIFLTRKVFHELGGYKDIPIMEDIELMRRVKARGYRIGFIPHPVRTAPRRWEKEGVVYCTLRNWSLVLMFLLGVSPHRLARHYRRVGGTGSDHTAETVRDKPL